MLLNLSYSYAVIGKYAKSVELLHEVFELEEKTQNGWTLKKLKAKYEEIIEDSDSCDFRI